MSSLSIFSPRTTSFFLKKKQLANLMASGQNKLFSKITLVYLPCCSYLNTWIPGNEVLKHV